jgi:hypothetical protein
VQVVGDTYITYIDTRRLRMPQLHLYVNDEVAAEITRRAKAAGLSVSRYLGQLVRDRTSAGWPPGWFEEVAGGWVGEPLERSTQGRLETRESLE